ncbi:polycystin-1-like protein 2 [Polymixia lowei]
MTFNVLSGAEDEKAAPVSCPEYQEAFNGSCYEFVSLQHSFLSAQAWCEQGGGHLAFIPNEETQHFLQQHLDPERDWWLGLAPAAFPDQQDSTVLEGPLSWLDGSDISYSSWLSSPQPGAACGHILRNSAFHWEATGDCSQELHFVCQFESGRAIVCAGRNAPLQCGSGQVVEIDRGFYGRKTVHYCRSTLTASIPTRDQCRWINVVDSLAGQCNGHHVCEVTAAVASFGEPCPGPGSYLSVDYHCSDGLKLAVSEQAAVYENVTISVKWLRYSLQDNLTCKLSTGDGHIIDLHSPERLESSVVHKYTHPSSFAVGVECTSNERHVTAQKIITIQERITKFGVISCYIRNLSLDEANCKALHGSPLEIQVEVQAGTDVTYRIESEEMVLANLSVGRGIVPQNITVRSELVERLGPGCHQLTLHASNTVTIPGVSTNLQVCVLENVEGLKASVLAEEGECPESPDLNVAVSLERGAPVLLLFFLTGDRISFSETREMLQNTQQQIYYIRNPIQGCDPVNVDTDVKMKLVCDDDDDCPTVVWNIQDPEEEKKWDVKKPAADSLVEQLPSVVEGAVAQLGEQGLLSGATIAQVFQSVSALLNDQSDESKKDTRQEMLNSMIAVVEEVPNNTPEEVQVTARGLAAIIKKGSELSLSAKKEAACLVTRLSSSLLSMDVDNNQGMLAAVLPIMDGVSNLLDSLIDKNTSDAVLSAMKNVQSALLREKEVDEEPTFVHHSRIGVFVKRVTSGSLQAGAQTTVTTLNSVPSFSVPSLPPHISLPSDPVDVRMLSFEKNPFSWRESGNISSVIGTLSLTREDGSNIPVEDLTEDIEVSASTVVESSILLPRPIGEQGNSSVFLDLRNHSTTVINIPSPDYTLVLKMEPSEDPLPMKLFLGYKEYPSDTNYVAMTQMPHQGSTQEERYTWLLDLKDLKANSGVYYLLVRPIVGPGIKSINANLSITSIISQCKYWDESKLDWSSYGCRVGFRTTPSVTQCLCTHLTSFGSSFFVTPNLIDVSRTAALFGTFAENPVVVCFVGALCVAYLLVVAWARRKDVQDTAKVKVTVLEDNEPMDEYRYMLTISTGQRRGASTSSQVVLTLMGTEGESEPHHLTDPEKCVFERGGVDMFLMTTPFCLGDLHGVRLWHDNSGSDPSWYVNKVMVQDLQMEQKWYFLCSSWLAIDLGDCTLDRVFPVATEMDLKKFSNLFFMKTTKDFRDSHLWFSVISRPPSSTFTCVQRVSCCFSLLLCTMLTSIMFWGIPTDPSEQTMDLGHFEFTWQQFMIGIQSSLIMFPVNLFIVSIFRNTRPREMSCCKPGPDASEQTSEILHSQTPVAVTAAVTVDTVIKDITRIARSLPKTMKSNILQMESEFGRGQEVDINAVLSVVEDFIRQQHKKDDVMANTHSTTQESASLILEPQLPEGSVAVTPQATADGVQKNSNKSHYLYRHLCHIEKDLSLLGASGFPNPDNYSQAVQQVQDMKCLLEDKHFKSSQAAPDQFTLSSSPAESTDRESCKTKKKACCHGGLPWWFVFVGWLLVIATSCTAGFFTMLYGLKFGKERSISWLISMSVSFFESLLITQPLKVLSLAVFFALVLKNVEEEDCESPQFVEPDTNPDDPKATQLVRGNSKLYKPPPLTDIERMRRNKIKDQKAFALIIEILTYTGFMWMLLLAAYGQKDPNAFLLTRHIRQSFSKGTTDSMSLRDVFTWTNSSLLGNLFSSYPGFITDGNSKLVGNARLRQVRVQKNSCSIARSVTQLVPDCRAPYSWETEDMGSYGPSWNRSEADNVSQSHPDPWRYQTDTELRSYTIWGKMAFYRGGGFVVDLGPDLQNASSTLQYLFNNTWLDTYTRGIFVEFTVYNANVNLFCIVTLMLETTAIGAFQFRSDLQSIRLYQSTGGLHIFVMAAEIMYFLFIFYYMFLQGKLMKQQRWAYFRSKWNLLELGIILLSWGALSVFIKRTLLGNRDVAYYHDHKDQFVNFHSTAAADAVLGYLIAFLVLLATVKLWHLLRLNPKLNMITATLQRAWTDISGFLLILTIMFLAYSIACNVLYGWKMSSYRTLMDAFLTLIRLQLGIFNYDEILSYSPVLGALLIGSCIVLMTFVVLNLFISVILTAFSQEQIYHKPSEEEEIVHLMLIKVCSLFGIRLKAKDRPEASDATDSAVNNERKIAHISSADLDICQTSDNPVNL